MTTYHLTFDNLLQQLQARHGGKITLPNDNTESIGVESWETVYPAYESTIQGTKVRVEPMSGNRLHIHAYSCPMPAEFEIHPKGIADRLFGLFGMGGAVKSGNREFDRHFATNTDAVDKSRFLQLPEVYHLIRSLAPFACIKVNRGGVMLERDCEHEEYITADAIGEVITKLISLLAIAARHAG